MFDKSFERKLSTIMDDAGRNLPSESNYIYLHHGDALAISAAAWGV